MTHYDANDTWSVRGKLKATAQATGPGEAVILGADGKLPGSLISNIAEEFTVLATAWTGNGPYTASMVLSHLDGVAIPDFAPNAPNATQRTAFASARISVASIDAANNTIALVADGTKPTVALPCLMAGVAGTPTGKWTSSFPGGLGGGGSSYVLTVVVSPNDASSPAGITVTIEDSSHNTLSEITDANGQCAFTVEAGETYDISCDGSSEEVECSADQQVTISQMSTVVTFTSNAWPTISISAGSAASGWAYSIVGDETYSGVLNSSGAAVVTVEPGSYTVSVTADSTHLPLASQSVSGAQSGSDYAKTFTPVAKPIVTVTVVDASGGTGHQSRTVYADATDDTKGGTTDSDGECTIMVDTEDTYSIGISSIPTKYFSPVETTLAMEGDHTYAVTLTLNAKPTMSVQVHDNSGDGAVSGRTVTISATGQTPIAATTNSNGLTVPQTLQAEATFSVTCDLPSADYVAVTPATQAVVANQSYTVDVYLDKKPTIALAVTDSDSMIADPTVILAKATLSTDPTVYGTAYLDSSGEAVIQVPQAGTYTVELVTAITGAQSDTDSVTVALNDVEEPAAITVTALPSGFLFSMTYDATTFQTDPTSCLVYADDCAGFTPVSGPGSSLAACSTIGSWGYNNDGSSSNDLLDKCFYATFHETVLSGETGLVPFEKLNPNDLTMVIATWDEANGQWVPEQNPTTGTSHITTLNTMFCYPALYRASTSGKISISDDSSNGTAYGATIDGKTYQYVAIGVYEGYNDGGVLKSLSGKSSTASQTRPTFRSQAQANVLKDGKAMVWNFHQWTDWKIMTFFGMKSFNGQSQIGQGGKTYNGSGVSGLANKLGPWAGDNVANKGTNKCVKALIEDPWGYKYEFIDDFVVNTIASNSFEIWAGQNGGSNIDDSYAAPRKTKLATVSVTGNNWAYAKAISQDAQSWGLISTDGGSVTVGLCDGAYFNNTVGQYLGRVGGSSSDVSSGDAGPSYLFAGSALVYSYTSYGARLAFVFDM